MLGPARNRQFVRTQDGKSLARDESGGAGAFKQCPGTGAARAKEGSLRRGFGFWVYFVLPSARHDPLETRSRGVGIDRISRPAGNHRPGSSVQLGLPPPVTWKSLHRTCFSQPVFKILLGRCSAAAQYHGASQLCDEFPGVAVSQCRSVGSQGGSDRLWCLISRTPQDMTEQSDTGIVKPGALKPLTVFS